MKLIKFKVSKGKNNPIPFTNQRLSWNINGVESDIIFDSTCVYNLNNNDQYDWNKLIGMFGGISKNTSIRWGWRYNIDTKDIEICPFVHRNNKVGVEDKCNHEYIHVPLNKKFNVKIEIDRVNKRYILTYQIDNMIPIILYCYADFKDKYDYFCLRNFLWFGGTSVAPNDIIVTYNYKIW